MLIKNEPLSTLNGHLLLLASCLNVNDIWYSVCETVNKYLILYLHTTSEPPDFLTLTRRLFQSSALRPGDSIKASTSFFFSSLPITNWIATGAVIVRHSSRHCPVIMQRALNARHDLVPSNSFNLAIREIVINPGQETRKMSTNA